MRSLDDLQTHTHITPTERLQSVYLICWKDRKDTRYWAEKEDKDRGQGSHEEQEEGQL